MLSTPATAIRDALTRGAPLQVVVRGAAVILVGWFLLRTYSGAGSFGQLFQFTVIGLSLGCVYAIAASGLVLTYTTTGVFNFAHGAVGMVCAFTYQALRVDHELPTPVAMALVLLVLAPLIGVVLERIMRSFRGAGAGTSLTVTIALTILVIGVVQRLFQANGEQRSVPYLFGDRHVTVFDARIRWDEIAFFLVAVAIAVALRFLLFRSRTGTAMRAVVDNPELAALNGARPTTIARYSWVLGSVLAGLAGVLIAPTSNPLDPLVLTFTVLAGTAYGAAVFGRLRSLPLTFAGAILLGLLRSYAPIGMPEGELWDHIEVALPGVFLFLVLLVLPEARLSVGRVVGRDTPPVPTLRRSLVGAAVFLPAVVLLASLSGSYLDELTQALIYGTLLLSLVLLTGYSGQISLAQYVFFGLGAFAMGKVAGGDSLLGLAAAAAIAVPFGIITALPAMRLQGLYLALVTFAVAIVSQQLIFQDSRIFGSENIPVGRLEVLGLDFSGNRAFAFLCALVFAAVGVGLLALRRGALGRRLAALRDSQAACATLGLDVRRTKLMVFALSAAIAGLAGALQGGLAGIAGSLDFEPTFNVILFLYAFVGGITTVSGALVGGVLFAGLPLVQSEYPDWAGVVFAVVALTAIALGRQPNGLAGLVFGRRSRPAPAAANAAPDGARATERAPEEVMVGAAS